MFLSNHSISHFHAVPTAFILMRIHRLNSLSVAFIRIDIRCFAAIKIAKTTLANYLACRDGFGYFYMPAYAGYVNSDKGNGQLKQRLRMRVKNGRNRMKMWPP
ncbi:hypothetical protein [Butyrivibrio sp. AE3003]|uniref:hypothetical protein n=1 Tax=Butyrivibrio sp. AE3003 TaxID=1496721 RepID=UPI00047AE004|nr:hypothetical protein [Butyrivibrio sp. AE3003]